MPRPIIGEAYRVWDKFRALWRVRLPSGVPKVPPVRLDALASGSTHLRTILINLTILIVLLIVGPVIAKQFWRNQVLIEPIAVPAVLQRTGLTPEVAASRLWDGLAEVQAAAGTSKTGITAIPDSEKVDFSIPDAGISIDSLIHYVRDYFNIYETRITGEIRCATEACEPADTTIRLRVVRNDVQVLPLEPRGEMTEEEYFRAAASEVLGVIDPFTAIAAEAATRPEKARVRAKRLILERHPDSKWAQNLLGNLSTDRGEYDVALAYYNAALAIDPGFVPALNNLGENLRNRGNLAAARAAFLKAQKLEPGNPLTADGLADLASLDGRMDEAIGYFLAAAKSDPLSSRHLLKAGLLEIGAGRLDKAREYFLAALETDPTNGDVLQIATGLIPDDYALAERLYRDAADLAPPTQSSRPNTRTGSTISSGTAKHSSGWTRPSGCSRKTAGTCATRAVSCGLWSATMMRWSRSKQRWLSTRTMPTSGETRGSSSPT